MVTSARKMKEPILMIRKFKKKLKKKKKKKKEEEEEEREKSLDVPPPLRR
jgi:hypothetical protein